MGSNTPVTDICNSAVLMYAGTITDDELGLAMLKIIVNMN